MFKNTSPETQAFIGYVTNVTNIKNIKDRFGCTFSITEHDRQIKLALDGENVNTAISIPVVFKENGVNLIEAESGVIRAVNNFYLVAEERELSYYDTMLRVITGNPIGIVPKQYVKGTAYVNCLSRSIDKDALIFTFMSLSRAISYIVNLMPLHTTYMESWAKNQRLLLVDPKFDEITDPNEELMYHVEKNKKYYSKGWTSIGLSDSSLSGKNVILKQDLRRFVPFGSKFHNPQRNLYSILGMLGEEEPLLKTKSLEKMSEMGACWKGWNLFTLFVDIPDVWEDQILVDIRHKDKYIEYTKKVSCPGTIIAPLHSTVTTGDILAIHQNKAIKFEVECDSAYVHDIVPREENICGTIVSVNIFTIRYKRFFKDGTKITNMSANKGVIRLKDLGFATDPRTGERKQIDVIVSSKAVTKRKNYGQILEAIFNSLNRGVPAVIEDDAIVSEERIRNVMTDSGFSEECVWSCDTPYGLLKGVCGTVFWGVTHDADDTTWNEKEVQRETAANIRHKGLKFSPIEFKALETRFGKDNAITEEILSYVQGTELVTENLKILESVIGKYDPTLPVYKPAELKNIEYASGNMLTKENIIGTIADETYIKDGFYIQLPFIYRTAFGPEGFVIFEGPQLSNIPVQNEISAYITDRLYVPCGKLRMCWEHPTLGLYGVSLIVSRLKALLSAATRYNTDQASAIVFGIYARALRNYIHGASNSLGSKKGYISVYGMSVRYPYSSKGVATLSNELPKNVIEIHKSMAQTLHIKEGDVVLVERFPCLGFMSLRPQKVQITENESCRYTIKASSNSLGSLSLDFDGDVLYIASFHTEAAKKLLKREWTNPNKTCYDAIKKLNAKMGAPGIKQATLADYKITPFEDLNCEKHASIVESLTGVKAHTGPVVALAYNVMRIMENSETRNKVKINVGIELFLDRVANSVFQQKHGSKSMHLLVTDALCCADIKTLVKEGFDESTSERICSVIKDKAASLGISDLKAYHARYKQKGGSNIISFIVRRQNKIYFACRSKQCPTDVLSHLTSEAVDIPSNLFKSIIAHKINVPYTKKQADCDNKMIRTLEMEQSKEACAPLLSYIDAIFGGLDYNEQCQELRAHN